jgi:quercetin dioxygenase-like cupin family protein
MGIKDEYTTIVVETTPDGGQRFAAPLEPFVVAVPGVYEGAYYYGTDSTPAVGEAPGASPLDAAFPPPGGTRFGIFRHPAHSAGALNVRENVDGTLAEQDTDESSNMHASDTIDIEVILAGRVDLTLPGGDRRTVGPGTIIVVGGATHAWNNVYDEDCTFAAFMVGATRRG